MNYDVDEFFTIANCSERDATQGKYILTRCVMAKVSEQHDPLKNVYQVTTLF